MELYTNFTMELYTNFTMEFYTNSLASTEFRLNSMEFFIATM